MAFERRSINIRGPLRGIALVRMRSANSSFPLGKCHRGGSHPGIRADVERWVVITVRLIVMNVIPIENNVGSARGKEHVPKTDNKNRKLNEI